MLRKEDFKRQTFAPGTVFFKENGQLAGVLLEGALPESHYANYAVTLDEKIKLAAKGLDVGSLLHQLMYCVERDFKEYFNEYDLAVLKDISEIGPASTLLMDFIKLIYQPDQLPTLKLDLYQPNGDTLLYFPHFRGLYALLDNLLQRVIKGPGSRPASGLEKADIEKYFGDDYALTIRSFLVKNFGLRSNLSHGEALSHVITEERMIYLVYLFLKACELTKQKNLTPKVWSGEYARSPLIDNKSTPEEKTKRLKEVAYEAYVLLSKSRSKF